MKIALLGYGKMGKIIEKLALEKGHTIISKINQYSSKEEVLKAMGYTMQEIQNMDQEIKEMLTK